MNFKRIFSGIILLAIVLTMSSCAPKGVNILEQSENYVGEFYVPSSKKVEAGSALSVITAINEGGYKVKTAIKTESDDPTMIESYKIDCYGLNIELFHYHKDSERLKEITETGKYDIKSTSGEVLRSFDATVNGNFVLIFSSTIDYEGTDRTKENNEIIELFKSLQLQ